MRISDWSSDVCSSDLLKGGYDAGVRLVSAVKLFSHVANMGDTRSLIIHPSSTTHRQLSIDEQELAGAGPKVVRVSVGIEHIDDIIADLAQGLEVAFLSSPVATGTATASPRCSSCRTPNKSEKRRVGTEG